MDAMRPAFWLIRILLLTSLSGAVVTLGPEGVAPAVAQSDVEKRLAKALEMAIEDYDILQIQEAEKRLEDAIQLAAKSKYTGPALAKVYVMLGIVRFAATRDEAVTEEVFVSALENDYSAVVDPVYSTPTLEDLMSRAKKRVKPPTTAPVGVTEFTHKPIKSADAGEALNVEAAVPASMGVAKMLVLYRRFDETQYRRVEMKPVGDNRFVGTIPGNEVTTSQIEYFIFAEDKQGDIVAREGSDQKPMSIAILGSTMVKTDPDPDPDPDPALPGVAKRQYGYFSLMGGTGLGFLINGTATANPLFDISPGIAPAFGHALIDAGVALTDAAHLGIYFRFQFAPSQDFGTLVLDQGSGFWDTEEPCFGTGLPGDCLLGLKYKWAFVRNDSLRVYSSFGTGVGRVRNWLKLRQDMPSSSCTGKEILNDGTGDFCYLRDTVRNGWFHAGAGGGLVVPITEWFLFTSDLYLMIHLPETSINADLSLGATFMF